MGRFNLRANVESGSSGPELAAIDMGYAFEMLRFWSHHLWFNADVDTQFPAWLEGHVGPVVHGIKTLSQHETVKEARQVLLEAENDFNAAWADFRAKWLDNEHRRQIRFLQESDPECVPDDWAAEHSPLTWECWATAYDSLWRAALFLLDPLPICFRVGVLCARIEGLSFGLATQASIPGELYPIAAAQHALIELAATSNRLAGLDVDLQRGAGGVDFAAIKTRCRELYAEIRNRLANVPPNADRRQGVLQTAEHGAHEGTGSRSALRPKPAKDRYTPPELATQWGVSPDKIRAWIQSGELAATDVSATQGGRPRYLISQEAIETFEARRTIQTSPEPPRRHNRRDEEDGVIQFF